jgi:molecular chaperone DnaJ
MMIVSSQHSTFMAVALLLLFLQSKVSNGLIAPRTIPIIQRGGRTTTTGLHSTCVREEEAEVSLYQVLGIPRHASKKDIKQAFRRKALQYHPDVNPHADSTEQFQSINHAYQILNDPGLKLQYDMFAMTIQEDEIDTPQDGRRYSALRQEGPGPARLAPGAPIVKGSDLQFYLQIGHYFATTGGRVKLSIRRLETCDTCRGMGLRPGSKIHDNPCGYCHGRGRILQLHRNPLGHIVEEVEMCTACRGRKIHIEAFCNCCQGTGHVMNHREIFVDVPTNIRPGQVLRLRGCGNAGPRGNGVFGDLYIFVDVKAPSMFARQTLTA